MSIEEDINQRKFRNEYQKASINIIYTFNWMNEKMRSLFEEHELTSQQFNILRILRGAGQPISTLQIRQRMLDKMSDTSRIVDRLIVKGLAKKTAEYQMPAVALTDNGNMFGARVPLTPLRFPKTCIMLPAILAESGHHSP